MVREVFDATHLTVDDKSLNPKIAKLGEMKKAMPFVQGLKRRLVGGENPAAVFERKLPFDEAEVLIQITPALKKTAGCSGVRVVILPDEGKKSGVALKEDGQRGDEIHDLPPSAEAAVPGHPSFHFTNVE